MSLPDLLSALATFVADELVNTCDRDAPDRLLRYHVGGQSRGLPDDCCTEKGVVWVGWNREFSSSAFPTEDAPTRECPGPPAVEITMAYVVCWNIPEVDDQGVTLMDDEWDTAAAKLADVADCISRALKRLTCGKTDTEAGQAVLDALGRCPGGSGFRFRDAAPRGPLGGCAGVTWRAFAVPKVTAPES